MPAGLTDPPPQAETEQLKFCPRCDTAKPLDEFPLSASGTFGRYGYCTDCKATYMVERRQQMKADGRQDLENLIATLRRYGVDLEWYDRKVEEQNGKCLICGGDPLPGIGRLSVDHDHATGEARGLLCTHCNTGLGRFYDNPETLRRAALYIELNGEL